MHESITKQDRNNINDPQKNHGLGTVSKNKFCMGTAYGAGTKVYSNDSGPEVKKLFSCSTELSMKFQLLIKTKIPVNKEFCFKSLKCCIYHANKC